MLSAIKKKRYLLSDLARRYRNAIKKSKMAFRSRSYAHASTANNKPVVSNVKSRVLEVPSKYRSSRSVHRRRKRSYIPRMGGFFVKKALLPYSFDKEPFLRRYTGRNKKRSYKFYRSAKATYYEKIKNLRSPKDYANIDYYLKTYNRRIHNRQRLKKRYKRFRKWFNRYFIKNFKNYFSSTTKQKFRLTAAFKVFYFYKKLVRLQYLPRKIQRKRKFKRLSAKFLRDYRIFVIQTLKSIAPKLFASDILPLKSIFRGRAWRPRSALGRIRTVFQKRHLTRIFSFSKLSNKYLYSKNDVFGFPTHITKQYKSSPVISGEFQNFFINPNKRKSKIIINAFKLFNFKNFRDSISNDYSPLTIIDPTPSNNSDTVFRRFPKHKLAFFANKFSSSTYFLRANKLSFISIRSTMRNPKRYNRFSYLSRNFNKFSLLFKKRVRKVVRGANMPFFIRRKPVKYTPFLGLFSNYQKFNHVYRAKRNKFFLFFKKYFRLYSLINGRKTKNFKKISQIYGKTPFYLHVFKSTNNLFINLSAPKGRSLYTYSAGRTGYRGSKRLSSPALESIGKNVSQIFKNSNILGIHVVFHSPVDTITRSLLRGLNINVFFKGFSYYLNNPHNGLKKRAKRRV